MKSIQLTQGKTTLVDDRDFEWLSRFKWYWHKSKSGTGYAASYIRVESDKGGTRTRRVLMHNLISPPPDGFEIDHRDGVGLNNQRSNLRTASRAQQNMNLAKRRGNRSSQFKGVDFWKHGNVWRARIQLFGKQISLGAFKDELSAAKAYNAAAIEYFGDFARVNKLEESL